MDVLIDKTTPNNHVVRAAHHQVTNIFKSSFFPMGVRGDVWELIAVIVPARNEDGFGVTFAVRSQRDRKIRGLISATATESSLPLSKVAGEGMVHIDPHLLMSVRNRAMQYAATFNQVASSNRLH